MHVTIVQLWMYLGFSTLKLPKVCKMYKAEENFSWRTELTKKYIYFLKCLYYLFKEFLSTVNGDSVITKHTFHLISYKLYIYLILHACCLFRLSSYRKHSQYYLITSKHKSIKKKMIPLTVLKFLTRSWIELGKLC